MGRHILLLLALAVPTAASASLIDLNAARAAAAARAVAAAGLNLTGGAGGVAGGQAGSSGACIGSAPGGISLLGVQSLPGPSTQGVSPVTKLRPDNQAMQNLINIGTQMGMYANSDPTARARRELHDTFAAYVGYLQNTGGAPMAELFAWVYEGKMEAMARAWAEYQILARQYASLYQLAEAAGRACP